MKFQSLPFFSSSNTEDCGSYVEENSVPQNYPLHISAEVPKLEKQVDYVVQDITLALINVAENNKPSFTYRHVALLSAYIPSFAFGRDVVLLIGQLH